MSVLFLLAMLVPAVALVLLGPVREGVEAERTRQAIAFRELVPALEQLGRAGFDAAESLTRMRDAFALLAASTPRITPPMEGNRTDAH